MSKRTDNLFPYTSLFRSAVRIERQRRSGRHCGAYRRRGGRPVRTAIVRPEAGQRHGGGHRRLSPAAHHHRTYGGRGYRSEEHTSELQSLMRISYAVFCLKKKTISII